MIKIVDFDKSITYLKRDFIKGAIVTPYNFSLILERGDSLLFRVPSDLQKADITGKVLGDKSILEIIVREILRLDLNKGNYSEDLYTNEIDLETEFKKLLLR